MNTIMICVVALIAGGILIGILKPRMKGWFGEKAVAVSLSRLPEAYRVMHDVMIATERGTAQIDHIVLSAFGIFVIETKNYKGIITGSEQGAQWTKNMYGKKYSFRNPFLQNYGHVKALMVLLDLPQEVFVPIVAFTPDATLRVESKQLLIDTTQIIRTIRSFTEPKIQAEHLTELCERIRQANVCSAQNKRAHVRDIHTNIKEAERCAAQGRCPKCDGALVERSGKYGAFWGCSNYPKCRYTQRKY